MYPSEIPEDTTPILTVGVVADTHIPDQVRELHPQILSIFHEEQVSHILHAGDISSQEVLVQLRQVAPVTAVRGNRDIFVRSLRMVEELELGGVRLVITHGHGGWLPYLWDKWKFWWHGYQFERYLPRLLDIGRQAPVVVFGHTHHPATIWRDGKLIYNPGSASFGSVLDKPPTIGLLRIYSEGKFKIETRPLLGFTIRKRNWERTSGSGLVY